MFPYLRVFSQRKWRPLTRKKFKYTRSLPGFMFICALCFLNEPFIQSRSIFTVLVESFLLTTIKENMHPQAIHGVHAILDFVRHHEQESFPVLGSFAVEFGDHLRYWDHLRACAGIICSTESICRPRSFAGLYSSENKLAVPLPRINFLKNSFSYNGAVIWNSLSPELRQAKSLQSFRNGCRDFFV